MFCMKYYSDKWYYQISLFWSINIQIKWTTVVFFLQKQKIDIKSNY